MRATSVWLVAAARNEAAREIGVTPTRSLSGRDPARNHLEISDAYLGPTVRDAEFVTGSRRFLCKRFLHAVLQGWSFGFCEKSVSLCSADVAAGS
jgi:hypothetical protein